MVIICAGMFRSGSTWQYLVAGELLARAGRRFEAAGFAEEDRLAAGFDPAGDAVVKIHDADDRAGPLVAAGAAVLYSYRDLRDVVYSMAHKMNAGFREAVDGFRIIDRCLANDAFWTRQPGVLVQRYEDICREPAAMVAGIARRLGCPVGPETAAEIADQFSLASNRERAGRLADDLRGAGVDLADPRNAFRYDPRTLLHWNHLRDGRVGGWRETATPAEVALLAERCGGWLVEKGYEPDHSWADPARRAAA